MSKIITIFKKSLTNPAILYVITRYGTYIIQFINSLFIAVYLGPYYLGIWGFIGLVLSYISSTNFGIAHSANVILSVNKEKEEYVKKVIGNALTIILVLALVIILFLLSSQFSLGEKYGFSSYVFPVIFISILGHFNALFANIFRIYGKIFTIALNQSLYPVMVIFIIPFFRDGELLWAMVITNCLSVFISFLLFLIQAPTKFRFFFNWDIIKLIQYKGWHLFVYNSSLYFILISAQSFISDNYSVTEFGYYTFSYSFANAILLLLNSISYLIFPKILNRFGNMDNDSVHRLLESIRVAYISLSHLLMHFAVLLFPLFLLLFPNYSGASPVFRLIALAIILNTNSFGYTGLLMAKAKEKYLGLITFIALLLNIILTYILVVHLEVHLAYAMSGPLITYFLYNLQISSAGRKIINLSGSFIDTFNDVYPWRMMLPFFLSLIFIITKLPDIFFTLPFILYIVLNFKDLEVVKNMTLRIINNPNLINI
ncbi:MAG: oligosaccharide flippase family protein [Tissierellia bacterium]|nr:oligosaccharide flippase family protein [Tissierellia bacterium]